MSEPRAATDASNETTRAAGRGGVAVLGAKAFFIVVGLVQQTLLPKLIGQASFGALSRVLAVANVVNNVMVASATQGVSRAVARARERHDEALRVALRIHVILAVGAGALFALAAPGIAAFEHAPYIAVPLAAMAGVVACYGVYAALIGALNGTARFGRQAALDATFAVLRTIGLLGVGWLFVRLGRSGVLGATLGFVGAAACIVPLALRSTGTGRAPQGSRAAVLHASTYVKALVPLAVAQLFTNAVMQIDITLLGRFLSERALADAIDDAAKHADEWVAVYRECQLFAFLPYQLLFSVTQILFPYVARAHSEGDAKAIATYVARGARIGAIVCGLMVAVIAAMPGSLLAFAFNADVADRGQTALRVLAIGQGAFAMLGLASTVLVSLGKERDAAVITAASLIVIGVACFGFVPTRAFGGPQLLATALATSGALFVGLALAAAWVKRNAGAFVPVATAVRVAVALVATTGLGSLLPRVSRVLAPIEAAFLGVVYVVVLLATRELGADDAAMIKSLVASRRR